MSGQDVRDNSPDELIMHEEEPQGPTQSSKAMIIKLLVALALGIFIYVLPKPDNLPIEGHKLAAILVPVVFLWGVRIVSCRGFRRAKRAVEQGEKDHESYPEEA